jgi:hypothetical protein
MTETNKDQALFAECDAFLVELSNQQQSTLSGGSGYGDDDGGYGYDCGCGYGDDDGGGGHGGKGGKGGKGGHGGKGGKGGHGH